MIEKIFTSILGRLPKRLIGNLSLILLAFLIFSTVRQICLGGSFNANLFDHFSYQQSLIDFLYFYLPIWPFGLLAYGLYVKTNLEREQKKYDLKLLSSSISATSTEQKTISRFTYFMAKYGIGIWSALFIIYHLYQLVFQPENYFSGQLAQSPNSQLQTLIIIVIFPFGGMVAYTVFYIRHGVKMLPSLTKYSIPVFLLFYVMVNAFAEAQQIKIGYKTPRASIVLKNGREIHTSDFLIYFAHSDHGYLLYDRPQGRLISIPDQSIDTDRTIVKSHNLVPFFRM